MATKYYSPQIRRDLVSLLYHEAKRQRKPMTQLVDELLSATLRNTPSISTTSAQRSPDKTAWNQFQ
jgi:hypothetical protein